MSKFASKLGVGGYGGSPRRSNSTLSGGSARERGMSTISNSSTATALRNELDFAPGTRCEVLSATPLRRNEGHDSDQIMELEMGFMVTIEKAGETPYWHMVALGSQLGWVRARMEDPR